MAKVYRITNYGNTRSVYIKGQTWEISKHKFIDTDNAEVVAAWEKMMFVDVQVIEQSSKKKVVKRKKKVATRTKTKKNKQRKNKRRKK